MAEAQFAAAAVDEVCKGGELRSHARAVEEEGALLRALSSLGPTSYQLAEIRIVIPVQIALGMVANHKCVALLHRGEIRGDVFVFLHAGVEDNDVRRLETVVLRLIALHATEMHSRLEPGSGEERDAAVGGRKGNKKN